MGTLVKGDVWVDEYGECKHGMPVDWCSTCKHGIYVPGVRGPSSEEGDSHDSIFKHEVTFEYVWLNIWAADGEWVARDELIGKLLQSVEIQALLTEAKSSGRNLEWSDHQWIGTSIVDWFTQKDTMGENPYSDRVERRGSPAEWRMK